MTRTLTIVGAGWAGLSAAVTATQLGWQVELYEAARHAGGRARALPSDLSHAGLDNGQHILIGAYHDTLALMRKVGVDLAQAFVRLPLDLRTPDGHGLQLPDWPAPWNAIAGMACARGWSWHDKLSLLQACVRWQWQDFRCPPTWSVMQLCEASAISPRVCDTLIDPLCLSALNTLPDQACANVFLRVLHDALFTGQGASDLLLPRTDLSALFVTPCMQWLQQHGARIHLGQRCTAQDLSARSDPVVLACGPWDAARLTALQAPAWAACAGNLTHEAIATVYLHANALPVGIRPIMALPYAADAPERTPAQFVFNREALTGAQGLLAAVVSACTNADGTLADRVRRQVELALGLQDLKVVQTVVEKRATLRMSPQLIRPSAHIHGQWWACGDYVAGPYPSTLEGAVRCGHNVVTQLTHTLTHHAN